MKYSSVILALAATISAQSITDLEATIPQCARACLASAVASSGCAATDFACQCGSGMAAIKASATTCITSALGTTTGCSIPDALMVQPVTDKICAAVAAMPASSAAMPASSSAAVAASSASSMAPSVSILPVSESSDGQVAATSVAPKPASSSVAQSGTYSTVYTTQVKTITSCAPTVTACPVGKITTEIVSLYTTFCPYSSTETHPAASSAVETHPAASSAVESHPPASSAKQTTTVTPIAPIKTTTVAAPVISQISDGQIQATAAKSTTPAPAVTSVPAVSVAKNSTMTTSGKATATSTPAQFTGAASSLKVGGFMGALVALVAFAL